MNDFATRNGRDRNVGHSLDSKLSGRHTHNQAKGVNWVNWWFRSDGEVVSTLSGVVVNDKQQTDVGVVSVCIDADADGFDATVDCNDSNPAINPDAEEVCNLIDDNCDDTIDEGFAENEYWRDSDHDFWGDPNNTRMACTRPIGYTEAEYPADCDDGNSSVRPDQNQYFTQPNGDSYDYNCNNVEEIRMNGGTRGHCTVSGSSCVSNVIVAPGYWVNGVPGCGETGGRLSHCVEHRGTFGNLESCSTSTFGETQACR